MNDDFVCLLHTMGFFFRVLQIIFFHSVNHAFFLFSPFSLLSPSSISCCYLQKEAWCVLDFVEIIIHGM